MGKKVLVIEDNELNMKLVSALLSISHFEVISAANAEIGLQLARKEMPDLILMDIQLPGMDGLTATRLIKKDKDLREIPVIALTSYAMQGDEQKAFAAGCTGYIPKPIDTRKFIEVVGEFLDDNPRNQPLE
ncbi:MAG: response regulator [Desulfobacteraceae bacterium]|nr:MAG: response regulator [Desulfobacteraceae bacterium]